MEKPQPSPFEAVLRGLRTCEAEDPDGPPSRIASTPWYVAESPPGAGEFLARDHYRQTMEDDAGAVEHIVAVAAFRSVEIEDIRRELDLANCRTVERLQARRREFARDNHPDRVDPALAANATERMMIANRLIDAEITRLRAGGGW